MKAGRFFVTGLLIFTFGLTACGAHKDARPAAGTIVSMRNEGNALIAQVPKDRADLKEQYGIELAADSAKLEEAKTFDWSKFNTAELQSIKQRLQQLIQKVSRIESISQDKRTRLKGDVSSLAITRDSAKAFLALLENHEENSNLDPNTLNK